MDLMLKIALLVVLVAIYSRQGFSQRQRVSQGAWLDGRTSDRHTEQLYEDDTSDFGESRSKRFLESSANDSPSWMSWSSESGCSISCGGRGFKELVRKCSTGHDDDCRNLGGRHWKVEICDNGPCVPIWLEWGPLSPCSVTCAFGVQARLRNCSTGTETDCSVGKKYDLQVCDAGDCITTIPPSTTPKPIPVWSEWSEYIHCSATCGPGYSEKKRTCSSGINGDCAGKPWEVSACDAGSCHNDGEWSVWGAWSSCSASCDSGNRTRARTCDYPDPTNKGDACLGYSNETESCNEGSCPVDGVWSNWSTYEACSKTCGPGVKIRTKNCTFPENAVHGKNCDGLRYETSICNNGDCPADGIWTSWSSWAPCTQSCHGGIRFKARVCVYDESKPHGKDCAGETIQTEVCNTGECLVDGIWGSWLSWSQCSHSCGGGLRSRTHPCSYNGNASHGKACVGNATQIEDCGTRECPVDASWNTWGSWAQCSVSCGGGFSSRLRNCTYPSPTAPKGKTCDGNGFELKNCSTKLCPVDGYWSNWSRFSTCSVTCGEGERERTRTCVHSPVAPLGGDCLGSATEKDTCTKAKCPVDGSLTDWTSWGLCSASCNGGSKTRSRQCSFPDGVPHGDDCLGQLSESSTCNELPCPTTTVTTTTTTLPTEPGHWSDWLSWSPCSKTCDSGTQNRSRFCTYPDHTLHGEKCPGPKEQTRQCNTDVCPVDGIWLDWSLYSRCSVSCGNGTRTRTRKCQFYPLAPHGANCTGPSLETDGCFPQFCPVDGSWSNWHEWSSCSTTCGGGAQSRQRSCDFQDGVPHGLDCVGEHVDNQTCSTNPCPVDGALGLWGEWSECTVTCGGGTHMRNRTCDFPDGVPRGSDCIGKLNQTQGCNSPLCKVDGQWSNWEEWSSCSATCGGGSGTRTRTCIFDDHAPHGTPCAGATVQSKNCNPDTCPVDGHFSLWSAWTSCSTTCGNGTHDHTRQCIFVDDVPRGADCNGSLAETEDCYEGECPVDGVLGAWSPWTPCTVSCGNGTSARNRSCDFPGDTPHGNDCVGDLTEEIECGTDLCPIDGVWASWSNWTMCTLSCGGGVQQRDRQCEFDPVAPSGDNCTGDPMETQSCEEQPCPVDGQWSEWGDFSNCSATCGNGTQFRTRRCLFKDGFPPGENCTGSNSDAQECNTNACPVDGQLSVWSDWNECSKSCNNGTKTRNRTCDFPDGIPHGNDCLEDLNETVSCHEDPCPIDGHWSEWTNYTDCSVTCGGGVHTRNRTCIFHNDVPHGAKCFGNVTEVDDCKSVPCPVDGIWGAWQDWSACTATCGGGKAARIRQCQFQDGVPPGKDCVGDADDIKDCGTDLCAVDGKISEWSSWTPCSGSCGPGVHFKTRQCVFDPVAPHGANCTGSLREQEQCTNSAACPVDGFWAKWGRWSSCTQTCGGGTRSRRRTCNFPPGPTGHFCPGSSVDREPCNNASCPVDGQWTPWSDYTACSATCGGGNQIRTRNCTFPDGAAHGSPCPGQPDESLKCNVDECPQDAQWSVWTDWSPCSTSCEDGTQSRNRTCSWPSAVHGNNCTGDTEETQTCNDGLCPVDGTWSDWGGWGSCSVSCNVGLKSRNRTCDFDPVAPHGAICIGENVEQSVCSDAICAVDGRWSSWQPWSQCSETCGNGTELRSRRCSFIIPGAPHGKDCPGLSNETRECENVTDCPVDGYWDSWSSWGSCSATCGNAVQQRTRVCLFDESKPHGFDCFGSTNETQNCRQDLCPVDGTWDAWTTWDTCSVTCGGGSQARNRTCMFTPDTAPHGTDCSGNSTETIDCNTQACPVDGNWEAWDAWSACTESCGGGSQSRNRTCLFSPDTAPHGVDCPGNSTDIIDCNANPCAVDGSWDAWTPWDTCSVTCGSGSQARNRTCIFTPDTAPHGTDCSGNSTETIDCNTQACPVDGTWDAWTPWDTCSVTCGGGSQARNRTCIFTPDTAPHGTDCSGNATETIDCNTQACPVDGTWDAWTTWDTCSVTCGGGSQARNRTCIFTPDTAPHGTDCSGNSTETIDCNTLACPVDGTWDAWTPWDTCSMTCGGGSQARNRTCIFTPDTAPHGSDCSGNATETIDCNTQACPVDGTWDAWTPWDTCSVTCGGGSQARNRTCIFTPDTAPHGTDCSGNSTETTDCNTQACPVDGTWDAWTPWDTCSVTCGGGSQARNRTCIFTPDTAPHGTDCSGNSTETIDCNTQACPVDGTWDAWTPWDTCSVTCGGGDQARNRTCIFTPDTAPHGTDCSGNATETIDCNTLACPVDGTWDAWTNWDTCSVTCGSGSQARNRTCIFTPDTAPHGSDCSGNATETIDCNTQACPVDGTWDAWTTWDTCSVTCGGGSQARNRTCIFTPDTAPHGSDCSGNATEATDCNTQTCPVDGTWDAWTTWDKCSVTCGGGSQARNRTCIFTPDTAPHGSDCSGNATEATDCNTQACPVDGTWDAWTTWDTCSVTCGGGSQARNRTCIFTPDTAPHGSDCSGNSTETTDCNTQACPVDGTWDAWTTWDTCSVTCGGGSQARNRTCIFTPDTAPHGSDCSGNATEATDCNIQACPVDGTWDAWTTWDTCSVTCGGGSQARNRTCIFTPDTAPHGSDCSGNSTETIDCNTQSCPPPTTTTPPPPHSCNLCLEGSDTCEDLYYPLPCDPGLTVCINNITNKDTGARFVDRRCGTMKECRDGWYNVYSSQDTCVTFDAGNIYGVEFYCEYCCTGNDCNEMINMPNKYSP